MDGHQFDRLTRQLDQALSRRRFGTVLAALGLWGGVAAPAAKARKKGKKKKKKPAGCASGTVLCGSACVDTGTNAAHCGGCGRACAGNQTCTGGECVEPPECVDQYGCGGYSSSNGLACRNGRCVCATEGEGLCQRYADRSGRCHQCCPGGNQQCRFDEVCFYDPDFEYGPLAYCDCPTGWQRCNYNPHPTGTCVQDPKTDSRKCGPFCEDCTANTTWPAICCDGFCTRGCDIGASCPRNTKCGPNCLPCNSDSICCNQGQGTLPRCIPDLYGGTCYFNR